MHGSVNGSRGRGGPKRTWFDDIKDWNGRSIVDCLRASKGREYWRHGELIKVPQRPTCIGQGKEEEEEIVLKGVFIVKIFQGSSNEEVFTISLPKTTVDR